MTRFPSALRVSLTISTAVFKMQLIINWAFGLYFLSLITRQGYWELWLFSMAFLFTAVYYTIDVVRDGYKALNQRESFVSHFDFISLKEASELLGEEEETLIEHVKKGRLPSVRLLDEPYFRGADLMAYREGVSMVTDKPDEEPEGPPTLT